MGLGRSTFLIAVGATRYAVTAGVSGVEIAVVGLILMIVGAVGLALSVLWVFAWSPRGRGGTRPRGRTRPYEPPAPY